MIEDLISKRLDPFETNRLCRKLRISKDAVLTFDDTIKEFTKLIETDLDNCIIEGFKKLDINDDGTVSIKGIKQALLLNKMSQGTQPNAQFKDHNQRFIKEMSDTHGSTTIN